MSVSRIGPSSGRGGLTAIDYILIASLVCAVVVSVVAVAGDDLLGLLGPGTGGA